MLNRQQKGFTLIELMVSIVIGLFLLAGVLTIYINSRASQRVVDEEVRMMDDARFALETMAYDLRHAGLFGQLNHELKDKVYDRDTFLTVTDQCGGGGSGWVVDLEKPVFAVNDDTDYLASCMADWAQGDTIEVRYATIMPAGTLVANLISNALYLKSTTEYAYFFRGDTPVSKTVVEDPANPDPNTRYFQWQSRGYYISNFTDQPGDGVPSLRLVSVEPGPAVTNTVLLKGVEDIQIQFGLDQPLPGKSQGDESADSYVHPDINTKWNQAIAARVWLVMRSERPFSDINTPTSFEVAGVNRVYNDRFKRIVVSTSVRLRNLNTGD